MNIPFWIFLVMVIVIIFAFVRLMNSNANDLEWSELVSTKGQDGKLHPDWNKIGQGCGILTSLWLPAVYVYSDKMEAVGLAAVMAVALGYLGGVSSYAATLRARRGTVETVTEPAADKDAQIKTTKTETPQ